MTAVPTTPFELIRRPSEIDLFRFSAVTWNAHRIHYDAPYAASEGLPGVVVQAHLHGAYLAQAALKWGGPGARLRQLTWRNTSPAVAGDELTVRLTVTSWQHTDDHHLADVALEELNAMGTRCVVGSASVALRVASPAERMDRP